MILKLTLNNTKSSPYNITNTSSDKRNKNESLDQRTYSGIGSIKNRETSNQFDFRRDSNYQSNYSGSKKKNKNFKSIKELKIQSFKNNPNVPLITDEPLDYNLAYDSKIRDEEIQCKLSVSNQNQNKISKIYKISSNRKIKNYLSTPNYIFVDGKLFKREMSEENNKYNNFMQLKNMKREPYTHKNSNKNHYSQIMKRNVNIKPKKNWNEMLDYIENNPQVVLNAAPSRVEINTPVLHSSSISRLNRRQADKNFLFSKKGKVKKLSEGSPIIKNNLRSPNKYTEESQERNKMSEMQKSTGHAMKEDLKYSK